MKDKFINFRATEKEKKQLMILAKKAKMSQADFIRHAVFNKEIVVIDGLIPLQKELKRIGNNLNQLTTRSNMGHFSVLDLVKTKDKLRKIYESLAEICLKKDEPNAPIQCVSFEDNLTEENNIDGEQIVHPEVCHEKTILNGFGRPKTNSIFSRNRGE